MTGPSRVLLFALFLVACGGHSSKDPDADIQGIDRPLSACGNGVVEPGEDCDDGNLVADAVCDSMCHFTCGNGAVDTALGESCDTAITSGTGACPTTCNDSDSCTSDVLSGSECTAMCVNAAITSPVDGDGCCPAGATANNDTDCSASCGNGTVETGEMCDTGITAGTGACPTTCNDAVACTADALVSGGSCAAHCTHVTITTPTNNDGCCPSGANNATDNDCSATCGNGVVESGETCDTAIGSGTGKCPTTCNDSNVCTTNTLVSAGTCTAVCTYPPITTAINSDGCCPAGANANTDNDCQPMCGNGVKEGSEACDDGNQVNTDACSNTCTVNIVATAYRFGTLALRDPHTYATVFGCNDITNSFFGNAVNEQLTANLTKDNDGDTFLDLSPTLVFRPLNQGATATTPLDIYFAKCSAPLAGTMCQPDTSAPFSVTATNMASGTCLGTVANSVHVAPPTYSPAITTTSGPCFSSGMTTVVVNLAGVNITLHNAQVAATYVGTPATSLTNGLLRGFVTQADADATIFPANLAVVGGKALSSVLPGGTGACPTFSDKDTLSGVSGWWFYLNYTGTKVPWSDN